MNKKEIGIYVATVLSAVGLVAVFNLPPAQKVTQIVREQVVGSSGNEYSAQLKVNDGVSFAGGIVRGGGARFILGTTTPCSILSPVATSTLLMAYFTVTKNATTTLREASIGTSTVPYATTSPIIDGTLLSVVGNQPWMIAVGTGSTTAGSINSKMIFPPSTYLTLSLKGGNQRWGIGTTTGDKLELDGYCSAVFVGL